MWSYLNNQEVGLEAAILKESGNKLTGLVILRGKYNGAKMSTEALDLVLLSGRRALYLR